jgi:hypothetical protein
LPSGRGGPLPVERGLQTGSETRCGALCPRDGAPRLRCARARPGTPWGDVSDEQVAVLLPSARRQGLVLRLAADVEASQPARTPGQVV